MLYRKVAAARHPDEIERVLAEAADRYGTPPDSVLNLADYGRIRVMADRLGVESIDREGRSVVIKFRPQTKLDPARLISLVRQRPDIKLVPPSALKLNLDGAPAATGQPGPPQSRTSTRKGPPPAPSWWTARAKTGEVRPGFTKQDILRPVREDPRSPGGTFDRVGSLLSDLLGLG
jgi:TRCF domain